jgi:Putative Flp pilus-assembly TadE/G-like
MRGKTMPTSTNRFASNRGAILVHVAVALVVIIAFSAFAVDFGLMWVSRSQAQNAADSAAMAGAIALAYDSPSTADDGPAKQSALTVAQTHRVWGQAPAIDPATDITFPVCPDGTATCIRVDVFRDGGHGNPLPMIFGGLVNLASQNTRATATAQARIANASFCLKPWIIPDMWEEHYPVNPGTWNANTSTFDTTTGNGNNQVPLANPDVYRPPTSGASMTGFRASGTPNHIGLELVLKAPQPSQQNGGGMVGPGWVYPVRLNEDEAGGNVYMNDIQHCANELIEIGDLLRNETGVMVGPTMHGVDPLIASDQGAQWVDPDGPGGTPGSIVGSCMATASCPAPYSPSPTRSARIIEIPVFNPATFSQNPGAAYLEVVNIIGFFLLERQGNEIRGVITHYGGVATQGGQLPENAAFSHTVVLVR